MTGNARRPPRPASKTFAGLEGFGLDAWDRDRLFRLIPEAREFDWVGDLTPVGWLYHTGSVGQAIAYADLFWPRFVEHDGCVLLADRFDPPGFQRWMASTRGDRRAVEAVLNHTHLTDLFLPGGAEPTREQVVHLGRAVRDMWAAKLARDFPGRRFEVRFPEDGCEALVDYQRVETAVDPTPK